jgi:hypothetical protein
MLNAMDPIPIIGLEFQIYFPTILIMLCFCNLFALWSKLMTSLGLEELSFSEVFDQEKVDDGKRLAKIGKYHLRILFKFTYFIERTSREREIFDIQRDLEMSVNRRTGIASNERVSAGSIYSSKYFIENPTSKIHFNL